jgi:hypothetical protein
MAAAHVTMAILLVDVAKTTSWSVWPVPRVSTQFMLAVCKVAAVAKAAVA